MNGPAPDAAQSRPSLYLLIVNYYSVKLIQQLLQTVGSHALPVVVVNNAPDDEAVPALLRRYPKLELIEPGQNLGFGAGCGLGLAHIYETHPTAQVWLINPDTLLDDEAVPEVQDCFEAHSELAILGTRIRDMAGQPWFTTGRFNRWTGAITHCDERDHVVPAARTQAVDDAVSVLPSQWVSGCSLIVNLAQFQTCPTFDKHLFLYYEDVEFCLRYQHQGKSVGVTRVTLVTHAVSSTTGRQPAAKLAHATFSKLYVLKQHGSAIALVLNLVYLLLQSWGGRLIGDASRATGRWLGLRQFMQFVLTGQKVPFDKESDYAG
ncbi:MAG: glycosyltransferase family 2 protein [Cyanobacteria bacterium P01_D01_bin.14]